VSLLYLGGFENKCTAVNSRMYVTVLYRTESDNEDCILDTIKGLFAACIWVFSLGKFK
jgi:hypothetical protein